MTSPTPTIRCLSCGYDVASLIAQRGRDQPGVCPECGASLTESVAIASHPGSPWQQRRSVQGFISTHLLMLSRPRRAWKSISDTSGAGFLTLTLVMSIGLTGLFLPAVIYLGKEPSYRDHSGAGLAGVLQAAGFVRGLSGPSPTIFEMIGSGVGGVFFTALFFVPALTLGYIGSQLALISRTPDARSGVSALLAHACAPLTLPALCTTPVFFIFLVLEHTHPTFCDDHVPAVLFGLGFLLLMFIVNIWALRLVLMGVMEFRRRARSGK
jgi:hypothetical protein